MSHNNSVASMPKQRIFFWTRAASLGPRGYWKPFTLTYVDLSPQDQEVRPDISRRLLTTSHGNHGCTFSNASPNQISGVQSCSWNTYMLENKDVANRVGGEYLSDKVKDFCAQHGITRQLRSHYCTNLGAERHIRTQKSHHSGVWRNKTTLPTCLWEGIQHCKLSC